MPLSTCAVRVVLLLLAVTSHLKADHPCSGRSTSEEYTTSKDTFNTQQKLIEGFEANYNLNVYKLRKFGFTSDGATEQCVVVNYLFQCGDNSTGPGDTCSSVVNETCGEQIDLLESEWTFLWTTFDAGNTVGKILLNLAIYDLRVFGFDLCDPYKDAINITLTMPNSSYAKSCDNFCTGLLEFTNLLPGFAGQSRLQSDFVPESMGYSISWNTSESYFQEANTLITFFSSFTVVTIKFFIFGFCYEILQQVRKHKISHKTHKWFYLFWAAQVLISLTIGAVIFFDRKYQKNRTALIFFYTSFGFDIACLVFIAVSLFSYRCIYLKYQRRRPRSYSGLDGTDHEMSIMSAKFKLPPKTQVQIPPHKFTRLSSETEVSTVGTINIIDETKITFSSDFEVTLSGERNVDHWQKVDAVPSGTPIELPDEAEVKLSEGTKITLPRKTIFRLKISADADGRDYRDVKIETTDYQSSSINGNYITLKNGTEITLSDTTEIELASETSMKFSRKIITDLAEKTKVNLPEDTEIKFPWGKVVTVAKQKEISLEKGTRIIIPKDSIHASGVIDECVPPPLTLLFQYSSCGFYWKKCWSIFTNIACLILFLAFISYLTQAFPAIAISYYLNPTTSLIRLGFIEIVIVVMLYEISWLLFLLDKFTWLCYFNKYKKVPYEIQVDDDTLEIDKSKSYLSPYMQYEDGVAAWKDTWACKLGCCFCHWTYITTSLQIVTMVFIIGLSAALLYFLLNVVIQLTANPDNQFKDILAIVPTVALNLWLLLRQMDIAKALKNIAHKADESSHSHAHTHTNDLHHVAA